MIYSLICFFLFYILTISAKKIIIFVHPSTVLGISSEKFLPAIQNINLPGFHEINKLSLTDKSYQVFINFFNIYTIIENIKKIKEEKKFYMFNWSGIIYPIKEKKIASKIFFEILKKYKKNYPLDEIIIIACSHGGSVVLGMANLLSNEKMSISLVILLGTPINKNNEENAVKKINNEDYVFKKIINVYSHNDWIQKLDIIFNNGKFCSRVLPDSNNIINYETNFGHINLWHQYFFSDPFVTKIPIFFYQDLY